MDSLFCFTVNRPKVIHEILDGELVMINLETGNYYTMDGVGADIWAMVEAGQSVGRIISALAGRYQALPEQMQQEVNRFIAELEDEGLIIRNETLHKKKTSDDPPIIVQSQADGKQKEFSRPILTKYTDMKDLLLLDPIHEVDDTGWPNPKAKG